MVQKTALPDRGDLVWVNFNPQAGHEQAGHRPAVVISPIIYHEKSSLTIICPITSNTDPWPWKVMLPKNSEVSGAILIDQVRTIDRNARELKLASRLSETIMQEVTSKLKLLID